MLSKVQGVVVAVPGEEAAIAEFGGEFERSVGVNSYGESGAALVEAGGVGDAVNLEVGNFLQAGHHAFQQSALVLVDSGVCGFDRLASFIHGLRRGSRWSSCAGVVCERAAAEIGDVLHASRDSG